MNPRTLRNDRGGRAVRAGRVMGAVRAIRATQATRISIASDTTDSLHGLEVKDFPQPKAANVIPKIATRVRKFKGRKQAPVHLKEQIMDLNQHEGEINSVVVNEASRMIKKLALWNQKAAACGWLLNEGVADDVNPGVFNESCREEVKKVLMKIYDQNLRVEKHLPALQKQFLNKAEDKQADNKGK